MTTRKQRNEKPQEFVADEAKEQRICRGEQPGREAQQLIVAGQGADFARELLSLFAEEPVAGDG